MAYENAGNNICVVNMENNEMKNYYPNHIYKKDDKFNMSLYN